MIRRRFLDDLSWLCDHDHGSETINAVAAQSLPEGIKYRLEVIRRSKKCVAIWKGKNRAVSPGPTAERMTRRVLKSTRGDCCLIRGTPKHKSYLQLKTSQFPLAHVLYVDVQTYKREI
jgi:hypothetical protein